MLSKEVILIKYNISLNIYQNSILVNEIDILDSIRKKYLREIEDMVVKKHYASECFCCKSSIDSYSDEFCIQCGWYKCHRCNKCGCDYYIPRINKKYKELLETSKIAQELKMKIEEIDRNKKISIKQIEMMKNDNELFKEKLNKFVISGVKNETKGTVWNKIFRIQC